MLILHKNISISLNLHKLNWISYRNRLEVEMSVFSKMVREEPFLFLDVHSPASSNQPSETFSKTVNETVPPLSITYSEYVKHPHILANASIKMLKATAQHLSTKSYRVHKHGNKPELIERIRLYFEKWTKATKIQCQFRKFLAVCVRQLHGPAYTDLSKCVNDSDFFTMDPLYEMDRRHFYSYVDDKGFVYGFDAFSLMNLFKREHKIVNPYNREGLNASLVRDICSLFRKIHILHPDSCGNKCIHIPNEPFPKHNQIASTIQREPVQSRENRMSMRIASLRNLPLTQRIEEVFMEIDRLGNYTQSRWFSELPKDQYVRFYDSYFTWWSRLPPSTKREICYIPNPFSDIRYRPLDEVERFEYQEACLTLMEHMVYTGINEESRRLGALHILNQLTHVSYLARTALPWLYDSF